MLNDRLSQEVKDLLAHCVAERMTYKEMKAKIKDKCKYSIKDTTINYYKNNGPKIFLAKVEELQTKYDAEIGREPLSSRRRRLKELLKIVESTKSDSVKVAALREARNEMANVEGLLDEEALGFNVLITKYSQVVKGKKDTKDKVTTPTIDKVDTPLVVD